MTDRDPFSPLDEPNEQEELTNSGYEQSGAICDDEIIMPVPENAEPLLEALIREWRRKPSRLWWYCDANGDKSFAVARFDDANGKTYRPYCYVRSATGEGWKARSVPAPRPLFNLNKLAARPNAPVLVVEGEKCVRDAEKVFPNWVVVTSSGGAHAADKTDWPALAGRPEAMILPDADKAGSDYANDVGSHLQNVGISNIRVVDAHALASRRPDGTTREPPPGWDVADAVKEGWDLDALREAALAAVTRFETMDANFLQLPEHQRTEHHPTSLKRRFSLVRFADLTASKAPPQLIRGLIPRVGLTVVWGPPKSGKSFVTFDAMMHVAIGWSYRNRQVICGPVIYCAFEGAEGYGKRADAFRKHHNLGDDVPFYLVSARMDFVVDHPRLIASIRAKLKSDDPVAVVLDTLNRSLPGSESSDQDMAAYIKAADAVREAFNCAVIVVHHCGIDTSRPRGHTSLTGAVDAQLAVKRDGSSQIFLEVEWMKDGPEGDVVASRLDAIEVGTDEDGHPITSCVVVPVDSSAIPKTTKPVRVPRSAQTALRALQKAVSECGDVPPASNHIPAGVKVVSVDQWRNYAYRMGISTSTEDRAKQQAFKRASEHLIGCGHVGFWDGHAWPATEKENR